MGTPLPKGIVGRYKGQSALEYLVTYGWALLLVAIVASLLYLYVLAPSAIVPSQCSFASGMQCKDLILGMNYTTHAAELAIYATNSQPYPIEKPVLYININGVNTTAVQCKPNYVLAGGSIICEVPLSQKVSFNQLVTGSLYINALYCGLTGANTPASCTTSPTEVYSGSFNAHVQPMVSTSSTITLFAVNTTHPGNPANNAKDPLMADVKLLGYQLAGATVNFTATFANGTDAVPPYSMSSQYATTSTAGIAQDNIWGTTIGNVIVKATYAGLNASINITFTPVVTVVFEAPSAASLMSNSSAPFVTLSGTSYTFQRLTTTAFVWGCSSVHTYSFNATPYNSSGTRLYFQTATINGAEHTASSGSITVNCSLSNQTQLSTYQEQYLLSMAAIPSAGGTLIPGTVWYNKGALFSLDEYPHTNYAFKNWTGSGTGSYTGGAVKPQLTMDAPIVETAYFTALQSSTTTVLYSSSTTASTSLSTSVSSSTSLFTSVSSSSSTSFSTSASYSTSFSTTLYSSSTTITVLTILPSSSSSSSSSLSSSSSYTTITTIATIIPSCLNFLEQAPAGDIQASGICNTGSTTTYSVNINGGNTGWVRAEVSNSSTGTVYFNNAYAGVCPMTTEGNINVNQNEILNLTVTSGNGAGQCAGDAQAELEAAQYVSSSSTSVSSSSTTIQYYLTMSAAPSDDGSVSPASGYVNGGSVVTISESPLTSTYAHNFFAWTCSEGSGCYAGPSTSHSLTVSSAMTETANYYEYDKGTDSWDQSSPTSINFGNPSTTTLCAFGQNSAATITSVSWTTSSNAYSLAEVGYQGASSCNLGFEASSPITYGTAYVSFESIDVPLSWSEVFHNAVGPSTTPGSITVTTGYSVPSAYSSGALVIIMVGAGDSSYIGSSMTDTGPGCTFLGYQNNQGSSVSYEACFQQPGSYSASQSVGTASLGATPAAAMAVFVFPG